jgi:hypothetical protein
LCSSEKKRPHLKQVAAPGAIAHDGQQIIPTSFLEVGQCKRTSAMFEIACPHLMQTRWAAIAHREQQTQPSEE